VTDFFGVRQFNPRKTKHQLKNVILIIQNMAKTGILTEQNIALHIKNLTKRFGDFTAIDNVSFDIRKNEIFGLLGPNGAGKTTTISIICGLLPASEGEIVFNNDFGKDKKSIIGYCPQENIFYPKLSCFEQLVFIGQMYNTPTRNIKKRAFGLLELLGLIDKANTWATNLSGGMKRRLNIALALIHNPEILILDEPEAGLDPQSRILVRDFIKNYGKEKTIILTTHNMDEADRLADRVAIIDHGKLLLLDTPQNLKKTIGEGDILEIVFENGDIDKIKKFSEKISLLSMDVKIIEKALFIMHPNIIEYLPVIKEIVGEMGLAVSEIKLRQNTLEDVFIHLTGRNLRT
jgi:ABC-2 type transport system ATP-binding protein